MQRAAVAAIALLIPVLLVGNGIYVLTHEWFIRFEYARSGFPDDAYGMPTAERTRLAATSLHSILPWERRGIDLLREAKLADGSAAFGLDELRHMCDVRRLLLVLLTLHAATFVALATLAALTRTRPLVVRTLRAGAALTLALFAFVGALLLVNAVWFLTGFHTIFFEGSSWRFAETDTLRRLFPDRFWSDTALLLGIGAAIQAIVILGAVYWPRLRRRKVSRQSGEAGLHSMTK
jgi:integral membrane protein (TIGR01906 family)